MINEILNRKEFIEEPPVLLDLGASGGLHKDWKPISKYSICLAFDPDERDMDYIENMKSSFKDLHVFNSIVTEKKQEKIDFYLTESPYCSSTLKPYAEKLSDWIFADLFEIKERVRLNSLDLQTALIKTGLSKVDWIKIDTQGTDLRLFKSLGKDLLDKVLVAKFEPGIIDAYEGEDKFYEVLTFMDNKNFWIDNLEIRGTQRIRKEIVNKKLSPIIRKLLKHGHKISPGWVEVSYFNNFKQIRNFSERDILLGCLIAILKKQFGFGLELIALGQKKFNDKIYYDLEHYTIKKFKEYAAKRILSKVWNKIFHIPLN